MSWLFSRALVEEYSADTCSDGEPCAELSVMPTPQGFWRNDKMMDASRLSQFGPTLRLLTEGHGAELLTSFLGAFPARTYPSREKAQGWTASGPDSGPSLRGWFAKFDPGTSSWKTAQRSLVEDLELFSETWPRSGLMRNGKCYLRPTAERPICESEFGLWPTPTAADANGRTYHYQGGSKAGATPSLLGVAKLLPTPAATDWKGRYTWKTVKKRIEMTRGVRLPEELSRRVGKAIIPNPEFWEWMMGWPIGWTALRPLAMDKFREWQQQHSPSYRSKAA